MKAIQVIDRKPQLIDMPTPSGEGVKVRVVATSICGSDLHMMEKGWTEGRVPGHEFSGFTPDGTAVTVEPLLGCGNCGFCEQGYTIQCEAGVTFIGIGAAGGMAEFVEAPAANLVPLPTGMDILHGSLVEPLAVALHGLSQARITPKDRVLVIGAGAIGLAVAAALHARGLEFDIQVRPPHQAVAATRLGAGLEVHESYDVVIDAAGTSDSLAQAIEHLRPRSRLAMLGTFWNPVEMPMAFCSKEVEMIGAMTYKCRDPDRTFVEAARLLHENPHIADTLITHRFPLDAAQEAFATAADRASGAIKVCFEPAL